MTESKNKGKKGWMEKVRNTFQNGPLGENVVFYLLLVILEKVVELEFECPCRAYLNPAFVVTFFVIPGILAFVLTSTVYQLKCSCDKADARNFLHCIIPAIVWMILMLLDGRYLACAMTDWSGRYVIAEKADPVKWCEPNSTDSTLSMQRLMKSEGWYFHSQWAGILLAGVVAVVVLILFACTEQKKQEETAESAERGHDSTFTPMETSFD